MDKTTGACKVAKGSQVILDRADHVMVKAENLKAVASGIAAFLVGPKPEAPREEKPVKPNCFIGEVTSRLDEISDVLLEAQTYLDTIREQF